MERGNEFMIVCEKKPGDKVVKNPLRPLLSLIASRFGLPKEERKKVMMPVKNNRPETSHYFYTLGLLLAVVIHSASVAGSVRSQVRPRKTKRKISAAQNRVR